jgi:RNA polymerase sigma factor, sigma-70 family
MTLFRKTPRSSRTDFELVVATYERQLLAYVARITGGRSSAEDVVQETFIKLSRQWRGELAPGALVSAWLYKVAHNASIDHIRREKTRGEAHKKHAVETADDAAAAAPSDADEARANRVREALDSLGDRERSLVILKVYEEKSYKEIADIAGLSVGNVGFILHTAMKKLAKHISIAEEKSADKEGDA